VSDVSNSAFSILSGVGTIKLTYPSTAVNLGIQSLQQVQWTHNLGTNAFVRIELSRDGGLTYPEVVAASVKNTGATTGTFAWRVSGAPTNGAQARLRVTWIDGAASDVSDANSTIAPAFITVSAPAANANWGFGTKRKQAWTSNLGALDLVNVQLSTSGIAGPYTTLPGGGNVGAKKNTATVTVPNTPTASARIRVVWANPPAGVTLAALNPGNFTLAAPFVTVTAPSAGQIWKIGNAATIRWTSNLGALESVKVELSKDGGATYSTVVLASTPSDGTQKVTVQSAWGSQATSRIRVSWTKSATVVGQSAIFTIQP
jgi:hypothetical protein